MNMGESLRRNALKFPRKLAVRDERRALTYAELDDRVNQLVNSFRQIGLNKNDHVAVLLGNRSEHVELLFALAKAGLVGLPLDPKWRRREISAAIKFFDVDAIVHGDFSGGCVGVMPSRKWSFRARSFRLLITPAGLLS